MLHKRKLMQKLTISRLTMLFSLFSIFVLLWLLGRQLCDQIFHSWLHFHGTGFVPWVCQSQTSIFLITSFKSPYLAFYVYLAYMKMYSLKSKNILVTQTCKRHVIATTICCNSLLKYKKIFEIVHIMFKAINYTPSRSKWQKKTFQPIHFFR